MTDPADLLPTSEACKQQMQQKAKERFESKVALTIVKHLNCLSEEQKKEIAKSEEAYTLAMLKADVPTLRFVIACSDIPFEQKDMNKKSFFSSPEKCKYYKAFAEAFPDYKENNKLILVLPTANKKSMTAFTTSSMARMCNNYSSVSRNSFAVYIVDFEDFLRACNFVLS